MNTTSEREMRRLTLYIDNNLVKDLQLWAEKDRRSLSFMISDILQKAVNKKSVKKGNS